MVQFWKWRSPVGSTYGSETKVPLILERQNHRWQCMISMSIIGLSAINALMFALSVYLFFSSHSAPIDGKNADLKKTTFYSPILNNIEIPLFVSQINGSLFTPENPSIARQEPGPKIDDAWAYFELVRTHVITKNDVIELGKDPKTVARFDNDYWGFGEDAYMAQMDVFHQIHCLNMLRRAAFAGHGIKRPMKHSKIAKIHLGYCTDILMQSLMCNANTEMLKLDWIESQTSSFPDFSVHRKCKDINSLIKWRDDHRVDIEKYRAMKKPAEAYNFPLPDEYFELFGEERRPTDLPNDHDHLH